MARDFFLKAWYGYNIVQDSDGPAWRKYLLGGRDWIAHLIEKTGTTSYQDDLYFKPNRNSISKLPSQPLTEFDYFYEKHSSIV